MAAGRTFFVADLHLTDERPEATGRFFRLIDDELQGADALYILGDLFETWIGDDHDERVAHDVAARVRSLVDQGTPVYFMHGNRDFMLARQYAARSGMILLDDPTQVSLYGVPTVLTHGDTLCTDDIGYQRFRARVRRPWVLALLRLLPHGWRHRIARNARTESETAKAGKSADIMDVNAAAVRSMLESSGALRMIHGHTHRPARHAHPLAEKACERWVVPDWYGRWGYVVCDAAGCRLTVETS